MTETLAHEYSLETVLSESYPMNTNITGFRCFLEIFATLFSGYALKRQSSLGEVIPGGHPTGMSYLYNVSQLMLKSSSRKCLLDL